jgi:AAA+ ATPase superfamily predicted ATPase
MNATPFVYGKVADNENFTDREKDLNYLANNFKGLINTIIISPRRWGKTSLVNKAMDEFAKSSDYIVCKIDIFNCRTEEQFYTAFANSVLKSSFTAWEEFISSAKKYLMRMLPKIAMSDGSQNFELSFGIDFKDHNLSFDEILDLPQTIAKDKNKSVIVCIDEFQNINEYNDSLGFQQKLRSHWQLHNKVCYCLYGSKRHMLLNIFSDNQMPFYKFGDIHFLQKISRPDWVVFIEKRFNDTGKKITPELCGIIADKTKNHPYYTQQLSQQVWLRTTYESSAEIVNEAFDALVNQLSLLFSNIIDSLTAKQISFLVALANGEKNFSSKETLQKYDLGTSANIKNLKQVALNKDIIDILPENIIEFQDPVFEYWLKNNY